MSFVEDENDKATNHQKLRSRKLNAVAYIEREMRDFIPHVVRESGETAKVIALFAETTPRTVENWGDGQCLPSSPKLIALGAKYPPLRQKINEWMDAIAGESGTDPSRVLNEMALIMKDWMK